MRKRREWKEEEQLMEEMKETHSVQSWHSSLNLCFQGRSDFLVLV